jgi:hypothetical protein
MSVIIPLQKSTYNSEDFYLHSFRFLLQDVMTFVWEIIIAI